jgi:phenylpropionate dioxygenase-like ring-hydroxylating dioxygenase large terminal subunit
MIFQRNAWYVVAFSRDVNRQLQRRVIMDEPILIYRKESGEVVALYDRCPHRFAPLSRGTLLGDVIQCRYHGLQFDQSGKCVHNPHGGAIAPTNRVRSYSIQEGHDLVWIWMGAPELASTKSVPDVSYMDTPGVRTVHSYIKAKYRYDILIDNLLDLSHTDYLHVGSFTNGACGRSETKVTQQGDEVIVVFKQWDAPAPPGHADLGEFVNLLFEIRWRPGQVVTFDLTLTPLDGNQSKPFKYRFAHIATPETGNTTHYFMSDTRSYAIDDREVDAQVSARQLAAIEGEDCPMLGAIDIEMAGRDMMEMRPLVLPTDKGALAVRRTMRRLVSEETGSRVDNVEPLRSKAES